MSDIKSKTTRIVHLWNSLDHDTRKFLMNKKGLSKMKPVAEMFHLINEIAKEKKKLKKK